MTVIPNNTPPIRDQEDQLPILKSQEANNYLEEESKDRLLHRRFKIVLFFVGIVISIVFFVVGLNKASYLFYSNIELAKYSTILQKEQLELDKKKLSLIENKQLKAEEVKSLNLISDKEEKITSSKTISNGILLALVSIFFGIALTILLNLSKNSFNSVSGNTEIATPLGNIILDILKGIKDKISPK